MKLDEIRDLSLRMKNLEYKIRFYNAPSGIRYDSEKVQSSPKGDALEQKVINHLDDIDHYKELNRMKDVFIGKIPMDLFTQRQREFIRLYYFNGLEVNQCAIFMQIRPCAVYRLKGRVEDRAVKVLK